MTSHGGDGLKFTTALNRRMVVFCSLTAALLLGTAPHVLAHPAPNTNSNSAAANAADASGHEHPAHPPAGNQAEHPAHPPAGSQAERPAHPPAGNQAGPPAQGQANASSAGQANPPADRADPNNAERADHNAERADADADRGNLLADREHPREDSRATRSKAPARQAALQTSHSAPSDNNAGGVDPAQPPGQAADNQGNQGQGGGDGAATDPAGNNGTVKVDMNGDTTTRNNEAQGDCQGVTSKLFNFDGGEAVTITFSGQAPTEFTTLATPIVIADADGNQATSFSLAQIVPAGTVPAPSGGYHVRIEADGQNHDGGVKTKIFWLRCDTFDLAASEASTSALAPRVGGVLFERAAAPKVAGAQQVRPAAAGVNRALRPRVLSATLEGGLARTGLDAMHLVTLGALALFAGYAALRVSRRNSEPSSSVID